MTVLVTITVLACLAANLDACEPRVYHGHDCAALLREVRSELTTEGRTVRISVCVADDVGIK